MTYSYNATRYGRCTDFEAYFKKRLSVNDLKMIKLGILTNFLENYFIEFVSNNLPIANYLTNISRLLSERGKSIVIKNKYLTIDFAPNKTKTIDVATIGIGNKRQHQLNIKMPLMINITDENNVTRKQIVLDRKAIKLKFGPNFIHSMDAFVVNSFKERLNNLNKALKKQGLYVNYYTNHDSFYLTLEPFIKLLVMDCYQELYSCNYLTSICIDEKTTAEISKYIRSSTNNYYLACEDINNSNFIK
jgi:DNA-dependent RNA polymerase